MESVDHSRLLKFLVPHKETAKMAEPHFKMDTLNPNIESNVPGKQELREDLQDNFVPVMKVTRNEVAFTKGDVKLQKVSVTENISNGPVLANPLYSSVFSEAPVSQPLRSSDHHQNGEENHNGNDSKKSKSKIPTLKQTIEKIKEQRRKAKVQPNKEIDQVLQPQRPRRSSIPRLKKLSSKQSLERKESYPDNKDENSIEVGANPKTEEEFEKLFEEIVKNDNSLEIDDSILPDTPMDDEKLLNSFEEIIHAYDDNSLQPIVVDYKHEINKARSKIPLSRRISHDAPKKPPRRNDRRNSLKVSSNADIENSKIAYDKIKSKEQDTPIIIAPPIDISNGVVVNSSENKEVSPIQVKKEYKATQIKLQENSNTIVEKEIISFKIEETQILHEAQSETVPEYQSSIIEQSVDTVYHHEIEPSNDEKEESIILIEPHPQEKPLKDDTNAKVETNAKGDAVIRKDSIEEDIPILKGKVSRLINRLHSRENIYDAKKDSLNDLPKKKSVLSRIAIFERQETLSKLKTEIKPDKVSDSEVYRKPIIIEEVLKSSSPRNEESHEKNVEIAMKELKFTEEQITTQNDYAATHNKTIVDVAKTSTIVDVDKNSVVEALITTNIPEDSYKVGAVESNKGIIETTPQEFPRVNNETEYEINNKITDIPKCHSENRTQNENSDFKHETIIENRMKRFESITDIDNVGMKRSKSIVDIELGKSLKGKVHHIIESMNVGTVSSPKEVINAKERPRKKSVMEKIALFERKLVAVELEDTKKLPTNPPAVNGNSPIDGAVNGNNNMNLEEEYRRRTEELLAARSKYGSTNEMPYIELKNGQKMPVLAVGTALLDPKLIKHIVGAAIDLGYRAIDVAFIYGTERPVGEAIREKILDGTVKREELFIMSKLWSTFHHPELVEKACRASLDAMGLEYFDLYMIHNPMSFKEGGDPIPTIANVLQYSDYEYLDAWFAMEKLVYKGLVKGIGLSNFNASQVARVSEKGGIKPLVNQVECHPYLNQERLISFCKTYDVAISCFGTLGSPGTPADLKSPGVEPVIRDPTITALAAGIHTTPAQMLIRYQLERGHNVVVKASSAAHLWENLQSLNCKLTHNEVEALNVLNKNKRNFSFIGMGDTHKNYPFKDSF